MARFQTSDGLSLHFEDNGTGQPVLCLPGLTRTTRDFDLVAPYLSEYRMIALDYRGRGQSDWADDFTTYSVPREMQDVVELLNHLGLERVTILGTSRGGLLAMAMAASQPDRLSGVILNDVGPVVSADGIARIMAYVGVLPAQKTLGDAANALHAAMEEQFPDVALSIWQNLAAAQYRQTETGLELRYDPRLREALLAQAEAGTPPDLWPFFDALAPVPVGVLRGANSDILTNETLQQMHARHPNITAVTVPKRGHAPFLDEPDSVALIHKILKASA